MEKDEVLKSFALVFNGNVSFHTSQVTPLCKTGTGGGVSPKSLLSVRDQVYDDVKNLTVYKSMRHDCIPES